MFDRYDRLRSRVVSRCASDETLRAYNDLGYGSQAVYEAGTEIFRAELFNWEADALARVLPPPPGRILVGGAGGGRESFVLAERGYEVTAFEPSLPLVRSMATQATLRAAKVEALVGRYEQLPHASTVREGAPVDLSERLPFDAAIVGWTSYSHLRTRAARVETLRAYARLTAGPIFFSFYVDDGDPPRVGGAARVLDAIGLTGGRDRFSPYVGFYHLSRRDELEREVADAGLVVLDASFDDTDGRWPWLAAARPGAAGR
jgi:SAM-dependent methyltransferase